MIYRLAGAPSDKPASAMSRFRRRRHADFRSPQHLRGGKIVDGLLYRVAYLSRGLAVVYTRVGA